jgi:hypothetical protein
MRARTAIELWFDVMWCDATRYGLMMHDIVGLLAGKVRAGREVPVSSSSDEVDEDKTHRTSG